MLKKTYHCETCGAFYGSQRERDACFDAHTLPDIASADATYEPGGLYPDTVTINFGGETILYRREGAK